MGVTRSVGEGMWQVGPGGVGRGGEQVSGIGGEGEEGEGRGWDLR